MLKTLRVTLLPCLLLAGLLSLPASAQTTSVTPKPVYFVSVLLDDMKCKQYSVTVLDSSTPPKAVFYETGKPPFARTTLPDRLRKAVPGFDPSRDRIEDSAFPCDAGGTIYTEPNQGNPAGNPDDEMRRAQALRIAIAARENFLNSLASKKAQIKPILKPIAPRGTPDRTVAPLPQNTKVRQPTQTAPRP